jgi:hypothetical protein
MPDGSPAPQPTSPDPAVPSADTDQSSAPPGSKPYEEITCEGFANAAVAFKVLPTHGGVILRGPCPRCADPMDFPHVDRVYRRMRRGRSAGDPRSGPQGNVVHMICTCQADHPGRPEGLDGCGAYWNVTLGTGQP